MSKIKNAVGVMLVLAMSLSACAGGNGHSSSASADSDNDPAKLSGKCSILQYEPTTSAQYKGWQKGLNEFKKENTELDVEWATTNFEAFRSNAKVLLSGGSVPDVVLINTGNADAGQLASQGLIEPNMTMKVEPVGVIGMVFLLQPATLLSTTTKICWRSMVSLKYLPL